MAMDEFDSMLRADSVGLGTFFVVMFYMAF